MDNNQSEKNGSSSMSPFMETMKRMVIPRRSPPTVVEPTEPQPSTSEAGSGEDQGKAQSAERRPQRSDFPQEVQRIIDDSRVTLRAPQLSGPSFRPAEVQSGGQTLETLSALVAQLVQSVGQMGERIEGVANRQDFFEKEVGFRSIMSLFHQ